MQASRESRQQSSIADVEAQKDIGTDRWIFAATRCVYIDAFRDSGANRELKLCKYSILDVPNVRFIEERGAVALDSHGFECITG